MDISRRSLLRTGAVVAVAGATLNVSAVASAEPHQQRAGGVCAGPGSLNTVTQYPVPGYVAVSTHFTATANAIPVFVHETIEGGYVHFEFTGEVDITVSAPSLAGYVLSPTAAAIATPGSTSVSFTIDRPMKLLLHDPADKLAPRLYILVDGPEGSDKPSVSDPNVVDAVANGIDNTGSSNVDAAIQALLSGAAAGKTLYFEPGVYNLNNFVLPESNSKLYLAGGAHFRRVGNSPLISVAQRSHVKIFGRGTLDMDPTSGGFVSRSPLIVTREVTPVCEDIHIEGIVLRDSIGVALELGGNDHVVRNIKMVNATQNYWAGDSRYRSEGFSMGTNGYNVLIEDCLITGYDDTINTTPRLGEVRDGLTVRRCLFFHGRTGSVIKFSNTISGAVRNVAFEGNVLVHTERIIGMSHRQPGTIENIYMKSLWYERIRDWNGTTSDRVLQVDNKPPTGTVVGGPINNVQFLNVQVDKLDTQQWFGVTGNTTNKINGVTFDNLIINANPILTVTDWDIRVTDTLNYSLTTSTPTVVTVEATTPAACPTGVFTVSRTGSTVSALTVDYAVAGSAIPGTDYTALSGSVTIPAGQATATITVTSTAASIATIEIALESSGFNDDYLLGINATAMITLG